ncbi:hypothetical protein F5Y01DRAFT_297664 [Xylaria sp. FL0043]|nr:hypothetical protein F5Y01DRAFT_297664 [Xylaria sp. FL0043]
MNPPGSLLHVLLVLLSLFFFLGTSFVPAASQIQPLPPLMSAQVSSPSSYPQEMTTQLFAHRIRSISGDGPQAYRT